MLRTASALVVLLSTVSSLRAQNHGTLPVSANQSVARADICTDPYGAVCGGASGIEAREQAFAGIQASLQPGAIKALQSLAGVLVEKDFSVGVQDYANVVGGFYSLVMTEAAKRNVTEETIRSRLSEVRTHLILSLSGKTRAQSAVERLSVIMPSDFPSGSAEATQKFYRKLFRHCGIDGMAENAFYTGDPKPSFILCPGSVLKLLRPGAETQGLDFLTAHEMSHTLHIGSGLYSDDSYQKFVDCLASKGVTSTDTAPAYAQELLADSLASRALTKSIAGKSATEARRSISRSLSALCESAPDDGVHLGNRDRVAFVFANPALQEMLKCPVSKMLRPWCEVN